LLETLLDHVNFYRSLGLCVVPAIYGEKRPEVEWKPYQQRLPNDAEINAWFCDGKQHNIAIVCGQSNFLAVDCDSPEVFNEIVGAQQELLKKTLVVRTSRGRHIYLFTDHPVPSRKWLGAGIEIHGTGTIVVAPPSAHPSGARYEFVNPEVQRIAKISGEDLVAVIDAVLERRGVKMRKGVFRAPQVREDAIKIQYRGDDPSCMRRILAGVTVGARNEAACRLTSYLLSWRSVKPEWAWRRLLEWNNCNHPPLSIWELRNTFRSAAEGGYRYGCAGMEAWCRNPENCKYKDKLAQKKIEAQSFTRLTRKEFEKKYGKVD